MRSDRGDSALHYPNAWNRLAIQSINNSIYSTTSDVSTVYSSQYTLGASTILYIHLHLKFFNFAVSSIDNICRFIRPCNADWINLQRKEKMPRVTFEHFFLTNKATIIRSYHSIAWFLSQKTFNRNVLDSPSLHYRSWRMSFWKYHK